MLLWTLRLFHTSKLQFTTNFFSEESKQDSDLDEPWIMTVKGMHFHNFNKGGSMDDPLGSPVKHNGSSNNMMVLGNARDRDRDRDYNLNQQKSSQVS